MSSKMLKQKQSALAKAWHLFITRCLPQLPGGLQLLQLLFNMHMHCPFSQCSAMQEADENDSEADASDMDEDAEAKAERLGLRLASKGDVLPASASRRSAAAAATVQARGKKRALPPPSMDASGQGKQKSGKNSKKGRQPNTQGTIT